MDISQYRNEEIYENLLEIIIFPVYAVENIAYVVIGFFGAWVAGFWLLELVHIEYVIYGILGLVLALATGFFAGVWYLTYRFKKDIEGILDYSLGVLQRIVKDVDHLNKGTDASNRNEVLTLLFAGVLHIITIPVAASIVGNKVPFVGGYLAGLISRVLRRLANVFSWPEKNRLHAKYEAGGEGKILPAYLAGVQGTQKYIRKTLTVAIRVVQAPVALTLFIFAAVTGLFVWLIN